MNKGIPSTVGEVAARGPLSSWVLDRLAGRAPSLAAPAPAVGNGLSDDLQLALYLAYEGHYGPIAGVGADLEWDPAIIGFRRTLESAFEGSLVELVARTGQGGCDARVGVREAIPAIIAGDTGPSLSRHMESEGTLSQMREFVVHRSAYQLKEGDPHTFAIPRLRGRAKQLLVEIQAGEYGADAPGRVMHSELFAQTMRCLGLDDRPNAYLDILPASALMVSNLISLFGLNRRWRGALVGHLAVFEMTSVTPMSRYSRGLERMGAGSDARRFYEVHMLADAEHEVMALDMAEALASDEPELAADIVFGAHCVVQIERIFAEQLLRSWTTRQRSPVAA